MNGVSGKAKWKLYMIFYANVEMMYTHSKFTLLKIIVVCQKIITIYYLLAIINGALSNPCTKI